MPATTATALRDDAAPETVERRSLPRLPARLAVFVLHRRDPARRVMLASTHDVSLGGMFVEMRQPPRVGTVLDVEAFRPDLDEPPVRGEAVVRWRRRWRHPRGVGVEMLRMRPEDRLRLARWLGEGCSPPGAA